MSNISGVVQEAKTVQTKTGKTMYQFKLNGTWYGTMFKKEADQGDLVEFEAEQNGNFWNAKNVVNKGKAPAPVASPPQQSPKGKQDAMSKEDWEKKDLRIARQGCRNSANDLVLGLLNAGALDDMFEQKLKSKKTKFDVILALSDLVTERFYEDVLSLGKTEKIVAKDVTPTEDDVIE